MSDTVAVDRALLGLLAARVGDAVERLRSPEREAFDHRSALLAVALVGETLESFCGPEAVEAAVVFREMRLAANPPGA